MKKENSNNGVIITAIICATVIVLAIACFLFFYLTKSADETGSGTDAAIENFEANEPARAYPGDRDNPDSRFHSFDWLSLSRLEAADLSGLSAGDLRLLRNAIFAKHGKRFESKDLNEYFSRFPWYQPRKSDVTSELSKNELYNIDFIARYEGGNGRRATNDTGASSRRVANVSFANDYSDIVCNVALTDADVAGLSRSEIRILRNTIYARHGRTFKSADLNNYFRGFSWYRPYRKEVPPSELNSTEKHNIALFSKYE